MQLCPRQGTHTHPDRVRSWYLCMDSCVCVCICLLLRLCMSVRSYIRMYVCPQQENICILTECTFGIYVCICAYLCICLLMGVCMYVCIYVCSQQGKHMRRDRVQFWYSCVYSCVYVCICLLLGVCMSVRSYMRMYVCPRQGKHMHPDGVRCWYVSMCLSVHVCTCFPCRGRTYIRTWEHTSKVNRHIYTHIHAYINTQMAFCQDACVFPDT